MVWLYELAMSFAFRQLTLCVANSINSAPAIVYGVNGVDVVNVVAIVLPHLLGQVRKG
jgi:ABC-type phosphate transport system permease subunit